MLKSTLKNFIENLSSSPLTKHQMILHLYVGNTTFPNYSHKYFQIKIKIQHQHIHKHKNLKKNLLQLTSNTSKNFAFQK